MPQYIETAKQIGRRLIRHADNQAHDRGPSTRK